MERTYRYDAFISYSQAEDKELAPAIESALNRLSTPWHRLTKPTLRIFRDASSLGAKTGDLPGTIKEGLKVSEKLILLCSPLAVKSYYVNLEVGHFQKICAERGVRLSDAIILVVTGGDLSWNYEKNNWDWQQTNILPKSLEGAFTSPPLWIDFKEVKAKDNLDTKSALFESNILRVAAPLLGKAPSEIDSIEIRKRHKQRLFLTGVIAALFLSLIISINQTRVARNAEEVAEQKTEDERVARLAETEARQIAEQKTLAEQKAREAEEAARKVAEQKTEDERVARLAETEARQIAEQKTEDERVARLAEEEARQIAEQKTEDERQARLAEEAARQRTDSINQVLDAENTALTSLYSNDTSKFTKATHAYVQYYDNLNQSNIIHLAKRPVFYSAMHDAYLKKFPQLIADSTSFEIEKLDKNGKPLEGNNSLPNRSVYHLAYSPEIDLSITSLDNSSVCFGEKVVENIPAVSAVSFDTERSLLITGHEDGTIRSWPYRKEGGVGSEQKLLGKLRGKIHWLSVDNPRNLLLAATYRTLVQHSLNDSTGNDKVIREFEPARLPACFAYSAEDSLLFIGYRNGDLSMQEFSGKGPGHETSIYYDKEESANSVEGSEIYPPVSLMSYDASRNILNFSLTTGTLVLYKISPQRNPLNHYEMARIEYPEPIKDAFVNEKGDMTVALSKTIYHWPVEDAALYQKFMQVSDELVSK